MKLSDFHIGLEFLAAAGFRWRCTDVGTRTITAIQVDRADPNWYQGPPYIAKEVVFDEDEIERCDLSETDAIASAVREHEASRHPGYPAKAVRRMMKELGAHRYPRGEGVLRSYAGKKEGRTWMIELYLPFQNTYEEMTESDFIALPRASSEDVKARAERAC